MRGRGKHEERSRGAELQRTWTKVLLASLLLNALILTSFLTSEPDRSPASTWITAIEKVRYRVYPVETDEALAALHADAMKLSKEKCIACHGPKDESELPLHRMHLTSELLPGLVCHDCHRSISLEERGNEFVVRLVDVGFCKQCHSRFPGLEPNSPMKPGDFEVDCTTCHTGKAAYKHAQPYLSHVISPKECQGCHGGRILPWTVKHERDDWLDTHGPEALDSGEDTCFRCHEFGLEFCDECHAEKPPSHEPEEAWLNIHIERAQQDTRACFTCHDAEFCKECHVNHEADWLDAHPEFVKSRGSTTCEQCHSRSFCSFCHTRE